MRCPQSGNGCPLFVFLRRFVFFLSKRKKVFKKFKKSFEKAEEAPPAGRGRGGFWGGLLGGLLQKSCGFCQNSGSRRREGEEGAAQKGIGPGTRRHLGRGRAYRALC